MKTAVLIIGSMLCGAMGLSAQNDAISTFFASYENRDDVTQVEFSGKAFEMLNEVEIENSDEAKRMKELAAQITGLKIIVDKEDPKAKNTASNAVKIVDSQFEELVTVKDKDALVHVMVKESSGIVSELLVIVGADSNFVLMSVKGSIKLSDVGELTKQFNSIGQEVFSNSSVHPSEIKVFPNPVKANEKMTLELPETMKGADVRIFDLAGKEVNAFKASGKTNHLNSSNFNKGVYVVKATKGDISTTCKFIVE